MHWALAIYIFILNLGLGLQNNLIPKTIREKILDLGHILYTGFGQVLLQEILNLNFGFGFFLFFFFTLKCILEFGTSLYFGHII